MTRWVLICPSCNEEFTHSEKVIDTDNLKLGDSYKVPKPVFPMSGLEIECPNCGKVSVFQRQQLEYRAI